MTENMNERIRQVRKHFGISQTEFGWKIGVGLGVIKNLEQGKTTITKPLLELLCNVYGVNSDWLVNGEGDMFNFHDNSYVTELQKAYNLSPEATLIIQRFIDMNDEERDEFLKAAKILMKE